MLLNRRRDVVKRSNALLLAFLLPAILGAAEHWSVQYFYDKNKSTLTINDLKCPSATRGVAVGFLTEGRKRQPVSLLTSDGGATWTIQNTKEVGQSLFFLNESVGWMVTPGGLWKTVESGRSWRKLPSGAATKYLLQVCFLDENKGWAVGARKSAYKTSDGGKTWSRVAEAAQVNSKVENTTFTTVSFADYKNGMIVGQSMPPQPDTRLQSWEGRLPAWMVPERSNRREVPHLTVVLETRDGGSTWKPSTTSVFGQIAKVVLSPDGMAMSLFQFRDAFDYPAEVYAWNWQTGGSPRAFANAERAVTDIAFSASGTAYLAAIEPPGRLKWGPVPGKLKLLKSANLKDWKEMDVDYRAVASNAVVSAVDDTHAWVATDTGMILKLVQD